MNAPYYTGDDERDALTEPDPLPCESCGAAHDEACVPECGCKYCRMKTEQAELVRAIPAQREG